MSDLISNIKSSDYYIKEFNTWEASVQKIDENKAIYMLKKPGSEYQKVCLYTDGYFMCIYGDYGTLTFNQMTWKGSVFNLQYDNIGYQMEKLSHESRESLRVFDDDCCKEDIYEWLRERLENRYDAEDCEINNIIEKAKQGLERWEVSEFCEENNCSDYEDILAFVAEALDSIDEYEWSSFLRRSNLEDFDEECESDLWGAGIRTNQRYFINMFALKICAEKLENVEG